MLTEGSRTVLWSFWNVKSDMMVTSLLVSMWNSIGVLFSSMSTTQGFSTSPIASRKGSSVSPGFDLLENCSDLCRFAHSLVLPSFSTLVEEWLLIVKSFDSTTTTLIGGVFGVVVF